MASRLLVVDDDRSTLQLLQYVLERAGYEVFCAADGQQGLELVETVLPHLVIADVVMPELDGLEMCRRIRQLRGFELVPFIFLSARSQIKDRVEGLEMGADDYIAKPFDRNDLLARIEAVLRRAEAYQQVAQTDWLTQLGDRELFEERLREELYRARRYGVAATLALVAIDVDELDVIQKEHGSAGSDAVIRYIGRCLRDNVRALDVPARYSSSGFIVLMPHTSRDRAMIAIERLNSSLNDAQVTLHDGNVEVHASFGVAIVDRDVADMQELIQRVQESLIAARRQTGENIHVWSEDDVGALLTGGDDAESDDR